MDDMTNPLKVKPERLTRHRVAGCSIGQKTCLLHVSGWDMDQTIFMFLISLALISYLNP